MYFLLPPGLVAATQNHAMNKEWFTAQEVISDPANHNTAGKNFTDWRLPTQYELNLMYLKRFDIGAFFYTGYWCSTEDSYKAAWFQDFGNGNKGCWGKGNTLKLRAVRAF